MPDCVHTRGGGIYTLSRCLDRAFAVGSWRFHGDMPLRAVDFAGGPLVEVAPFELLSETDVA